MNKPHELLDHRQSRCYLAKDGRVVRMYLAPMELMPALRAEIAALRAVCFETFDGAWIGRAPAYGLASVAHLRFSQIEELFTEAERRG